MTFPTRRPLVRLIGLAAASLVAAASCSSPSKGSLVLAISTDMQTPKDIDVVSVFISTNSVPKLDFLGRVAPDGTVAMPSTLAILEPDDPNAQVRIRVTAFLQQKARVLRDVVTTVPHERTALLRVPLSFLDDGTASGTLPSQFVPGLAGGPKDGETQFDPTDPLMIQQVGCNFLSGETSVAGSCVKATVDSTKLVDYGTALVYGDGGSAGKPTCFPVGSCYSKGAPIDPTTIVTAADGSCSFPLTPNESGDSWNCALATTDGTGQCVAGKCFVPLESDPGEGFAIQPGKAVVMVPGVCKKLKQGAMLYVDRSSCATKVEAAPVCEPTTDLASDGGASDALAEAGDATAVDDATLSSDGSTANPDATTLIDAGTPARDAGTAADAGSSPDASGTCKSNSDCTAPPRVMCNAAMGTCVECLTDSNCVSGGSTCQSGVCAASLDGGAG
jgi:hypothetical protein